jgi:hypothetical protein
MSMHDPKMIEKIKKLLNLARDGGATEHEAALAMDRAQSIMLAHGLSMATIEAGGGTGESREKRREGGRAHKEWMRGIMAALAQTSFVTVINAEWHVKKDDDDWAERKRRFGYDLIGRESAVVQVRLMHEYLVRTVDRMARERGTPTDEAFKAGMGERIEERLRQRHEEALERQAQEAREAKARQAHPGAATGNALVVVLRDYAETEADLNEDYRLGLTPGTTSQQRHERRMRNEQRDRDFERLKNEGLDENVAYRMAYLGNTREEAEAKESQRAQPKDETPEQRAKREAREQRERTKTSGSVHTSGSSARQHGGISRRTGPVARLERRSAWIRRWAALKQGESSKQGDHRP